MEHGTEKNSNMYSMSRSDCVSEYMRHEETGFQPRSPALVMLIDVAGSYLPTAGDLQASHS